MKQIKICPTCGHPNPSQEILCFACMADISSVSPTVSPESGTPAPPAAPAPEAAPMPSQPPSPAADVVSPGVEPSVADALQTTRDIRSRLRLRSGTLEFELEDGEILGRSERGKEFLAQVTTVSRQHARVILESTGWVIEDMGSTNGTFLNGNRLPPRCSHPIRSGDRLRLSSKVEIEVVSAPTRDGRR